MYGPVRSNMNYRFHISPMSKKKPTLKLRKVFRHLIKCLQFSLRLAVKSLSKEEDRGASTNLLRYHIAVILSSFSIEC